MPQKVLFWPEVYKEQGTTPSYTMTFQLTDCAGLIPGVIFLQRRPGFLRGVPLGVM